MAFIGSRKDFVEYVAPVKLLCSECRQFIAAGSPCLVSIRNGKVKKRVCSEKCREQFEDRIWQQIASINTKRRRQR